MLSSNQTRQRGFTLIELVVVIVIIGILAAFAIPRFAGLAEDARKSSVRAMLGTLRSTSALVHGLALARSTANGATVPMEGALAGVVVQNGYPAGTAAGIFAAVGNPDSYTVTYPDADTVIFAVPGAATVGASCGVTYDQATAGSVPTITPGETTC